MKNTTQKSQCGFSVMELLIALVVSLVVFSMVFSLLQSSMITASANAEMGDATQSLRNADEFISRDLITAGDGLRGISAVWLPVDFVTSRLTNRNAASLSPDANGHVNVGHFISDNNIPSGIPIINTSPTLNFLGTTDRITFLSVDPTFAPVAVPGNGINFGAGSINVPPSTIGEFNIGEVYFVATGINATFGTVTKLNGSGNQIFWENGDGYGVNRTGSNGLLAKIAQPGGGGGSLPVTLFRMRMIQYFVDEHGKLIRRVYGVRGAGHTDSVIAEHLTTLQFRYTSRPVGVSTSIYDQPVDTINIGEHGGIRLVESSSSVETANRLHDGQKHQVTGEFRVGIRNLQFSEALMPQ